jgi:hypothetical protein
MDRDARAVDEMLTISGPSGGARKTRLYLTKQRCRCVGQTTNEDENGARLLLRDRKGSGRSGGQRLVGRERSGSIRDLLCRFDRLFLATDEAVDVLQLVILDVQSVTTEAGTVGEEHTRSVGRVDLCRDRDRIAAVPMFAAAVSGTSAASG